MPFQGQPITMKFQVWDTQANGPKTGDALNLTLRGDGDGTEFTPSASPVEIDALNFKGVYRVTLTAAENNYSCMTLGGKSATAGCVVIPVEWINQQIVAPATPAPTPAVPTATDPLTLWTNVRDYALTALAADLVSPQPDYSLDGESISREQYRAGLQALAEAAERGILRYAPYEIRTQSI